MAEARIPEFFGDTQIRVQVLDFMGLGTCMPREAWRLPSPQTLHSIALDYVYRTYSACGRAYEATHKRHYQLSHFHGACWEEVRRCPYASMWGSKWGDCLQMVPSNCVLNHMLKPWLSEVIYYCDYFGFGIICIFLTSFYAHFCIYVLNWLANSKVPRDQ